MEIIQWKVPRRRSKRNKKLRCCRAKHLLINQNMRFAMNWNAKLQKLMEQRYSTDGHIHYAGWNRFAPVVCSNLNNVNLWDTAQAQPLTNGRSNNILYFLLCSWENLYRYSLYHTVSRNITLILSFHQDFNLWRTFDMEFLCTEAWVRRYFHRQDTHQQQRAHTVWSTTWKQNVSKETSSLVEENNPSILVKLLYMLLFIHVIY